MRPPMRAFYFPDMVSAHLTLKKAILFFDEIHFIDRASYSIGGGTEGQIMTIGAGSPLRQYERSFREHGVPLYVHGVSNGPLQDELVAQVASDINDPNFLAPFQKGLASSATFRDIQIAPGNYGESGMQEDLVRVLLELDLNEGLAQHENAMSLLTDGKVRAFKTTSPAEKARVLINAASHCSVRMNYALQLSSREGMTPFADAEPFAELLSAKYRRAIVGAQAESTLQLTDLAFRIFDELIPAEVLMNMSFADVTKYRKDAVDEREAFLTYLTSLQASQGAIPSDADYNTVLTKIVMTEIVPAETAYRNKLQTISETLMGSLAKSAWAAVKIAPIGVGLHLFGALSWPSLLALAGPAASVVGQAAIDALVSKRSTDRDCSISYVLSLDS